MEIQFKSICHLLLFSMVILLAKPVLAQSGNVPYGNNPDAGHYLKMADSTKIYYEVYGKGRPVVLLHGGLFGDISEYEKLIPKLSEHFKVIAIETRGHGKSEIGEQPFTYELMVHDAYTVIRHETSDSTIVIGFSDGAVIAMKLTLLHPEIVRKMVFAGGNLALEGYRQGIKERLKNLTGKSMEQDYPDFVKDRKKIMPQPERWDDFVEKLKNAWLNQTPIMPEQLKAIKCPVMVVGGDRDQYNGVDDFFNTYKFLPRASLAIIPNSDHIVFYRRPDLMEDIIMAFIN